MAEQSISLQISPEARSAYFSDYLEVAHSELDWVCPGLSTRYREVGGLEFLDLSAEETLLPQLRRLSFVQGLYVRDGNGQRPLPIAEDFALHEDFVFGSKYRGKTNERLTQLLINIALARCELPAAELKLLDPMSGRGTTLLWAMRYGMRARGIEQDAAALPDLRRHLKKWTKLHRVKHQLQAGTSGAAAGKATKSAKKARSSRTNVLEFSVGPASLRLLEGDAREADALLGGERFNLLVSDLPYGVQHFTTRGTRNPLAVLEACADHWARCLKPGGVMVLSFNSYQPKRRALLELFESVGLRPLDFSAPHRMSESIVRDVVVLAAPPAPRGDF